MTTSAQFRPTFTDLRAEVERRVRDAATESEIAALIDQFMLAGGESPLPLVEYDGTVTWLYRDPRAHHVAVIGDLLGHDLSETRMARLAGSDLFYLTAQLPLDAQVAYAFVADSEPGGSIPDPLNPHRMVATHPLRVLSVLEMPGSDPTLELDDGESALTVRVHVLRSPSLGGCRRVWVHLPPGYDPDARRYPSVYFADGEGYLLSARLPRLLDALVTQGDIPPTIAVMAEADLADAGDYSTFLVDELVPWVDARYATSSDPSDRSVCGAGSMAAAVLEMALLRPEVFGGAIAQSPAMRDVAARAPQLAPATARELTGQRYYVDVGRYEGADAVEGAHALCAALIAGGATVSYQEFAGARSFVGWRTTLPDALRFQLGSSALSEI